MKQPGWYQAYLRTPHWRNRRALALYRAGHHCADCGVTRHPQVHHLEYARLGGERDGDLLVVCEGCHRLRHGILVAPPRRGFEHISAIIPRALEAWPRAFRVHQKGAA